MLQPDGAEQGVVAFLVQKELAAAAQARVDFAVFVEVRGVGPGAVVGVEVEDGALADVDEEPDVDSTPKCLLNHERES